MPYLNINGADLWYEDSAQGHESIVFSHGFLMTHAMFDAQVQELRSHYRCVRYDHRGQGRSEVSPSGYDMDALTADAAALIRQLGCAPCHFAGLSMGGFVGLRLALHHPELLRSLTLIETSADPEPKASRLQYSVMARLVGWFGFRPLLGRIGRVMFGPTFRRDPGNRGRLEAWRNEVLGANRTGLLRAAAGVLGREGVHERLGDIRTPTLIIVGDEDRATPLFRAQRMHRGIAGSRLAVIPRAGHSSAIEQAEAVSAAMLNFLRRDCA